MRVSLWISSKEIFLKVNKFNLGFGLGISLRETLNFLNVTVNVRQGEFITDLIVSREMDIVPSF